MKTGFGQRSKSNTFSQCGPWVHGGGHGGAEWRQEVVWGGCLAGDGVSSLQLALCAGETNKMSCQEVVCGQERPGRWLKPCTRAIAWVDCGAFWTGLWRAQCSSCHRANMPKSMACSGWTTHPECLRSYWPFQAHRGATNPPQHAAGRR